MKRQIMEYKCDLEGCDEKIITEGEGYPYDKGWRYIFNFNFKTVNNPNHEFKDKHFCSAEHLVRFVASKVDFVMPEASKKKVK